VVLTEGDTVDTVDVLVLILFIAGILSMLAAAFGASHPRISFGWLGAALVSIALALLRGLPG
jgi:hypothetical protein